MITIDDVNNMIAVYLNEHGERPVKICMTALDYDCIRYDCMNRIKMDCATVEEVREGSVIARLCGLSVSIGDKTCVME